MITIPELTRIANDFLREHYGLTLDIPIKRNNRLRRALGAFVLERESAKHEYEPAYIEISGEMFNYADISVMIDTLKHECVHYALFTQGRPHKDGHIEFETELKRLGIGASNEILVGRYYVSECTTCGNIDFESRKAKYPISEYVSGCCRAPMTEQVERIYNGTEAV